MLKEGHSEYEHTIAINKSEELTSEPQDFDTQTKERSNASEEVTPVNENNVLTFESQKHVSSKV